ncbi:zinc finger BED domain-containing protein 4-like [Eucyclogobius newberryi]|uniref:zinc finger BED domain-containing protein 4-like n=1 Tax=Eucyclogobius newberryi TaxID=166745 RepID=UPI003B5AAD78
MMGRSGRKRSSSVWDCFRQVGNYVQCMRCNATLKYCGGATSTMMHHMKKHAAAPYTEPIINNTEEVDEKPIICTVVSADEEEGTSGQIMSQAFLQSPIPSTDLPQNIDRKRLKRSSVWDVFIRSGDEVYCTMCDTKLKYKSSTTSMIYHIKNKHSEALPTHAEVNELICKMIEKDLLPVSVVCGEGFRELLTFTVQNFKMPTPFDITRLIEGRFHEKVEELQVLLTKVDKVAIIADFWTGLPSQKYVTVSCSFITEDWQGRWIVLQTEKLPSDKSMTAKCISERLLKVVEEWGLVRKVTACVQNTVDILPTRDCAKITWDYVACFATTLQLAVNDGLSEDLLCIITAAGKLVKHFNSNSLANEALEQKQHQMCLPQLKLIQSNKTRWDTICDMFESLLEQRWAIKAVLSDRTVFNRQEAQALEIEDDYWQIIENFATVLATLKWATTAISAETEVSMSNIYPITFSLIQAHLEPKENDVEQVVSFKLAVQTSLRKRMEVDLAELASKPALISSMLDPRHKHLNFLSPTVRLAAKVKLHELVSKLDATGTAVTTNKEEHKTFDAPSSSQGIIPSQLKGDRKNTMMLLLGDNYSSPDTTDCEAQVDYYLRDIAPSLDINPLNWWRANEPRFPKLAVLARHYLCVPGVALPLSSEGGQTFATMRTRLDPEHVNMLIFLNRNVTH